VTGKGTAEIQKREEGRGGREMNHRVTEDTEKRGRKTRKI